MRAVLHGGYVDYVIYTGLTERYPKWFRKEVLDEIYMDSHRYTFWAPKEERPFDYYEMTLVEDYSVFLRKSDGSIFCTSYDVFTQLYTVFLYEDYMNHGVAAFTEDCIEYVECQPGILSAEYPDWFYEFFTEVANLPMEQTVLMYDTSQSLYAQAGGYVIKLYDAVIVDTHCVFLQNQFGEVRHMEYGDFIKHYNPGPVGGRRDEY